MSETTYDKILEIATKSFAEKGYNGTSMREIAESLNITKAALYYHFPGKEEIFSACLTHFIGQLVSSLEKLAKADKTIWEKLRLLIGGMCNFSTDSPHTFMLFKQVMSQSFDKEIDMAMLHSYFKRQQKAIRTIVSKGVEKGELRDDIPVNLMTSAISGMIHYTSGPKMREMANIKLTLEEQIENLMKLLQGGFAKQ